MLLDNRKRIEKRSVILYNFKYMKRTSVTSVLFLLIVGLCLLSGCTGRAVRYVNTEADFSYIKNVAILPFNNLTSDKFAGEKVRSAMMVDLLSRNVFEVTEQGEVSKALTQVLRATGASEGMVVDFDRETIKLLGERLGVQAIIVGSVEEFHGSRGASGGEVTLSVRMLDTSSGVVLWQVRITVLGASVARRIIGFEARDKSILTQKIVKRALDTLL